MPMIPQAVIAILACARMRAIDSVVFGGFAAKELATRAEDATLIGNFLRILRSRIFQRYRLKVIDR